MTNKIKYRDLFHNLPPEKGDPLHDAKIIMILGLTATVLMGGVVVGMALLATKIVVLQILGFFVALVFFGLLFWFLAIRITIDFIRPIRRWWRNR